MRMRPTSLTELLIAITVDEAVICDMVCLQGGLGEEGPMGKSGRSGNKVIASSSSFHFLFVEYLSFW